MNYLIYSPYRLGTNSFLLLLDEAFSIVNNDENAEVFFMLCSGEMRTCSRNILSSKIRCSQCSLFSNILTNKYRHDRIKYIYLKDYYKTISTSNYRFNYNNIQEIKKINYNNVNIGMGAVSSYVSFTRNIDPKINKVNKRIFDYMLTSGIYVLKAVENIIESISPVKVFFFNGRFVDTRVLYELCKLRNIEFESIEYIQQENKTNIGKVYFKNNLPHSIEYNTYLINSFWDSYSNNKPYRISIGKSFFENRRNKIYTGDTVYVKNQSDNLLPADWNVNKKNIVIFNSSEDEYFSIGEEWDKYKLFDNQIDMIDYIVNFLSNFNEYHIYLRIHPNLIGLKFNYAVTPLKKYLNEKNVTVISPESKISTYKLIEEAEKCIVYGSTVGVEANYWRKPVILLGPSLYQHLDVAYIPKNKKELDILLVKDLKSKPQENSLKYGFFIMTNKGKGYKFIDYNYKQINLFKKKYFMPKALKVFNSYTPIVIIRIMYKLIDFKSLLYKPFIKKENK